MSSSLTSGSEEVIDNQRLAVNKSTQSKGRGGVEACPFAGIIQIKFNGNFSERIMPKQSSNTRHAHTYNLRRQSCSSQVSKEIQTAQFYQRNSSQASMNMVFEMAAELWFDQCSDYLSVSDSGLIPFSVSRVSSSVEADASLRSIRLWNQTALDLRHHSSIPMTVMPDMMTIA